MRKVFFVNAGVIPIRESAVNALAQWANDMERKLLGLHCGQMLERSRHRTWAASALVQIEMADKHAGYAYA